jgi:hypothetical protein
MRYVFNPEGSADLGYRKLYQDWYSANAWEVSDVFLFEGECDSPDLFYLKHEKSGEGDLLVNKSFYSLLVPEDKNLEDYL